VNPVDLAATLALDERVLPARSRLQVPAPSPWCPGDYRRARVAGRLAPLRTLAGPRSGGPGWRGIRRGHARWRACWDALLRSADRRLEMHAAVNGLCLYDRPSLSTTADLIAASPGAHMLLPHQVHLSGDGRTGREARPNEIGPVKSRPWSTAKSRLAVCLTSSSSSCFHHLPCHHYSNARVDGFGFGASRGRHPRTPQRCQLTG
jgi:hypothetical protein